MLTSKNRAAMRGVAQTLPTFVLVGKDGLTSAVVDACKDAFNTREIIKIGVLDTAALDIKELANDLASTLKAEVVETKGRKIVLYKFNSKLKHNK